MALRSSGFVGRRCFIFGTLGRSDAVRRRLPIKPFEPGHHETWIEE